MNRLFWKFFGWFLLAQWLTTALVVAFIWFKDAPHLGGTDASEPPAITAMGLPPPVLQTPGRPPFVGRPPPHTPHFPLRPVIVGFFTSLLFAYLLARYCSKPIEGLRRGFAEIGSGNFDFAVTPMMRGRHDELADLGHEFDRTAQRLKGLIESQKRLLNDVSHEVRSPLARMQLAIDLIEQQPERSAELLERIARESMRIDALMAQVLTLARLETTVQWPLDERVDLVDLVSAIAADVVFEAAQKNCQIINHVSADTNFRTAFVQGNTELLHRTIENILRNAIRFSESGTAIEIHVVDAGGDWEIAVTDHGPGVPEDKIARMFQPFERVDASTQQGYGLGLAIVSQTLKLHGGSVGAANLAGADHSGLRVWIKLPKA